MGEPRGMRSVQRLLKGATQSHLSSFHSAGLAKDSLELSVQQLLDLTPSTFQMSLVLDDEREFIKHSLYRNFGHYVQRYSGKKYLKDESFWGMSNEGVAVRFYLDYKKLIGDCRDMEHIRDILENKSFYRIRVSSNFAGIVDVLQSEKFKGSFEEVRYLMDCRFFGIEGIIGYNEGKTVGSNLEVLYLAGIVEGDSGTSNDVKSIEKEFGIEAAKSVLISEIKKRIEDPWDIANYMTSSGKTTPFTKQGISHKGLLTSMAFERPLKDIKESVICEGEDRARFLHSRIMTGVNPNLGTGYEGFDLLSF